MAASTSMSGAWSGACNGWPASSAKIGLATVEHTAYRLPSASWYDAVVNVLSSAADSPKANANWLASGMWASGVAIVTRWRYKVLIESPLIDLLCIAPLSLHPKRCTGSRLQILPSINCLQGFEEMIY